MIAWCLEASHAGALTAFIHAADRAKNLMELDRYFESDDGSLPEIELHFTSPEQVGQAFAFLFALGATDVTAGGSHVWMRASDRERPFNGLQDVSLVASGDLEPFHLVLSGIALSGVAIPSLGVLVSEDMLTLDYRMGYAWGKAEIEALILLLKELHSLGGDLSIPWWGADAERAFTQLVEKVC